VVLKRTEEEVRHFFLSLTVASRRVPPVRAVCYPRRPALSTVNLGLEYAPDLLTYAFIHPPTVGRLGNATFESSRDPRQTIDTKDRERGGLRSLKLRREGHTLPCAVHADGTE